MHFFKCRFETSFEYHLVGLGVRDRIEVPHNKDFILLLGLLLDPKQDLTYLVHANMLIKFSTWMVEVSGYEYEIATAVINWIF